SVTIGDLSLASGDTLTVDQGSGAVAVVSGMTITAAQISSLIYTPAPNANGAARSSFQFSVNDADLGTVSAVMTIHVAAVNDAPSFNSSPTTSATEDATYTYAIGANDVDLGTSLTITSTTLPTWLTLIDNGDGTATLSGTPTNED